MTARLHVAVLTILAALAALAACGPGTPTPEAVAPADAPASLAAPTDAAAMPAAANTSAPTSAAAPSAMREAVVTTYADIAYALYGDALATASALKGDIQAFLEAPSNASLAAAQASWLAARDVYGQTEAFRFYGGPIDARKTGVETLVNAWPLDEAYIDYVDGDPAAGIVNATGEHPEISAALLVDLNEVGSPANIATGFHAIEFLLWGQDRDARGPGHRSAADYVVGRGRNAARRREVLTLELDLLTQHLRRVRDAWDADEMTSYRAIFERETDASLAKLIVGLAELSRGELAGERMAVAYDTQDQEDEHSCFSDSTHRDLIAGVQGIANIWTGTYGSIDGTGLSDVIAAVDPRQADDLTAQLAAATSAVAAIPPPFDVAIQGTDDAPGRVAVEAAMSALEALGAMLAAAGATLAEASGGGA